MRPRMKKPYDELLLDGECDDAVQHGCVPLEVENTALRLKRTMVRPEQKEML
jgi:hypothetical protein